MYKIELQQDFKKRLNLLEKKEGEFNPLVFLWGILIKKRWDTSEILLNDCLGIEEFNDFNIKIVSVGRWE